MKKISSRRNFVIILLLVILGTVASCLLLKHGYKIVFNNNDNGVIEVKNAVADFNSMIREVVEDDTKLNIDTSNVIENDKKWMELNYFLTLTGDFINEQNCFVHNDIIVPITDDLVKEINSVQYIDLDLVCEKLGYWYVENETGYTLYRYFATKRLIVDQVKDVKFTYGAINKVCADDYVFLQYATEKEAMNAYENLKVTYNVDVDKKIEAPKTSKEVAYNALSSNPVRKSYNSWGGRTMGFFSYTEYLKQVCNNEFNDVVVAVIDSGINYNHTLFKNRVHEYSASFVDGDTMGQIMDKEGHGSHVAGTIAELTPNHVKILSLKTMGEDGTCYQGREMLAYSYVLSLLDKGVPIKVVNCSYGAPQLKFVHMVNSAVFGYDRKIKQVVNRDVAVCVSAGNDAKDAKDYYPASVDGVICVGAIDRSNKLCDFSNFGDEIDFVAPGDEILSVSYSSNNGRETLSGTSMSSPHIAAAFALLFCDTRRDYTVQKIKDLFISEAVVDLGEEGKDGQFGWGYINLAKLVKPLSEDEGIELELRNYTLKIELRLENENYIKKLNSSVEVKLSYISSTSEFVNMGFLEYFSKKPEKSIAQISTYNGLNLMATDTSTYKFKGWKIGQNENVINENYFSTNQTCAVKNMPDNAIIYIYAIYDYITIDVNIVFSFKDTNAYQGYMGYGISGALHYYKNISDTSEQAFEFSTSPRKMAFKISNVIPKEVYLSLKAESFDDVAIKSIRMEDYTLPNKNEIDRVLVNCNDAINVFNIFVDVIV